MTVFEKTGHIGEPHFFRGREGWLTLSYLTLRGWYTYDIHFEGVGDGGDLRHDQASCSVKQTLVYYWQEIFTFTLTSESEAILYRYHCIVCGINRTIERVVDFNVTWLGFVFVLISFVHIHGAVVFP